MKRFRWEVLYILIAIVLTFTVVSSGDYFGKKIKIEVGQIAPETIEAPFQVENELATQRKKTLAENTTPDVYKMDEQVLDKGLANIDLLFNYVETLKTSGITEEFGTSPVQILQSKSPIPLYEDEYKSLLNTDLAELHSIEQICINLLTNVMDAGIKENENKSLDVRTKLERTDLSNSQQKIAYEIIYTQIKANFIVDKESTALAKEEARNSVEPIYILQGERVIEQGTRVSEEAYAILNKIGYLNTDDVESYSQYMGLLALICLIVLYVFRTIRADKNMRNFTRGQTGLIVILYIISLFVCLWQETTSICLWHLLRCSLLF
ncbi:MAG: hypothetical protein RSD98_04420 [Niameybacter sp.]